MKAGNEHQLGGSSRQTCGILFLRVLSEPLKIRRGLARRAGVRRLARAFGVLVSVSIMGTSFIATARAASPLGEGITLRRQRAFLQRISQGNDGDTRLSQWRPVNTNRLILAVVLCLPVYMRPFVSWAEEDPSVAVLELLKEPAEKGDAGSQFLLSGYYSNHNDYANAYFWARKAADQGDPMGEGLVGEFYLHGRGVTQNYTEARKWLLKAADSRSPGAESDLAYMYYGGLGTEQNYVEALKWFLRAADHDKVAPDVQFKLGVMYYNGQGTQKDLQKAFSWTLKASEQDHAPSEGMLGIMYYQGDGIRRDIGEARKWELKAAAHDIPDSYYVLGTLYHEGEPIDDVQARTWFIKASNVENDRAQLAEYELGLLDYYGKGGPRNMVAAREWFLKAARRGEVASQYNVGRMLASGEGGPADYDAAIGWFIKAANQGNSEAKYNIGVMYQNGWGRPVNYEEARRWLASAAAQGNADAQRALAQTGRRQSRTSSDGNPFGRMLCNQALGTSTLNIFSPCNY